MAAKRVVIVGGGFGGLACARSLDGKPVDVWLLDEHNFHLFTPLLYQVATALLDPSGIAYPLRTCFRNSRNVRFQQARVEAVDFASKTVTISGGETVNYDYLVIATGSRNNYYGNEALAANAIGMKTLDEALRLRNHVLACLERASATEDESERTAWLTFVIAGGGPTGVEYAGALHELLDLVLGRDYPRLSRQDARIVLVEGQQRLLGTFAPSLGDYARRALQRRGVEVKLGPLVVSAAPAEARLSDGERIACRTIVWSAGVAAQPPATSGGAGPGRLHVDARLRVSGAEGVFAVGDAASVAQPGGDLPMLSPPAMQEGRYVAGAIVAEVSGAPAASMTPFRYRDKGTMATIGRNSAVAQLGFLRFRGFIGWLMWLSVHIYYLIGFRNRLLVLLAWGWNYLRYDRPIRIIAAAQPDPLVNPPPAA